jgi:hypothetical protein
MSGRAAWEAAENFTGKYKLEAAESETCRDEGKLPVEHVAG